MRFKLGISVLLTAMVAVLLVSAVAGCKKKPVDPLPATGAVAGWDKSGDTRTYAAKDLWQYMDGGAEQYVSAGVVSTATSDYKFKGQLEATVEVHAMGDAAGAKKIFDSSSSAGGKSVAIGDAGIAFDQSVAFRKGSYVVRVIAYQGGADTQQALTTLAQAIAGKL